MKHLVTRFMPTVALALGVLAGPAHAAESDCTAVKVKLMEYKIKLSKKSVDAGCVEFKVINRGVEDHEMIVTKARSAHAIPNHKGVVEEDEVKILGETEELATLKRKTLTIDMSPGRYVLFCNVLHEHMDDAGGDDGMHMDDHGHTKSESHFGEGMHTVFTVK